jgi:hypothetical protein
MQLTEAAMRVAGRLSSVILLCALASSLAHAQTPQALSESVPRVIRISGTVRPANGSPVPVEIVTFAIYADETGGTPLWQETQNVTVSGDGQYTTLLGATLPDGLPLDVFTSKDGRWLGVHVERAGEPDQPRTLLTSVPYALRALDADTLGGKPASAYRLAESAAGVESASGARPAATSSSTSTSPTSTNFPGFIPMFAANGTDLLDSPMYVGGAHFGINTLNPLDTMHVFFGDSTGTYTGYAVQNANNGANSYSGMLFYDQNGVLGQFQGFNNSTHEYRINNIAAGASINFMIGSSSKFLVANNGNIGLGVSPPMSRLDLLGDINLTGTIKVNGSTVLQVPSDNTNIGVGPYALNPSATNGHNTALGFGALNWTTGEGNTAVGYLALTQESTANFNTAVGSLAMGSNTLGAANTAFGMSALQHNSTGSDNVAVGAGAGSNATGSNNIYLGANIAGVIGESNTMYLGLQGTQTKTTIAGIRGITTGAADAVSVVIDSNGQLGTINSSRRYKEDIRDMADASSGLMKLRPVTYRYKQAYADGSKPIDYGLIAEEVEEVYPDLVAHLANGEVETVQYQKINAMLLNEVQKQHRALEEQRTEIELLKARLAALEYQKP